MKILQLNVIWFHTYVNWLLKWLNCQQKGKIRFVCIRSNLKYNVFDDVGVQNTDSLPVIRATFCLIFGIFVGFQKSHRFISYFNLLHTAAWGPDGAGWGLQFLLQIVVRFIHSYCKNFISTFNTDRRGTVGVGTI